MADANASNPAAADQAADSQEVRPRVWPLVVIVALMWFFLRVPVALYPESPKAFIPMFMGLIGSYLLLAAWWLFGSRVPWRDRLGGIGLVAVLLSIGSLVAYHPSLRGMPLLFFVGPWVATTIAAAFLFAKPLGWRKGRTVALVATVLALALPALLRYSKVDSNFNVSFMPRWQQSNEELLLAKLKSDPRQTKADTASFVEISDSDWPGFRGARRDGHLQANSLSVSWEETSPTELWRRSIGPGWSSFCIVQDYLYTQEQRGDEEYVVAYNAATGDQLWSTGTKARFEESIAGPGPRATPTFFAGKLYTTCAEGIIQCLDAQTGERDWQHNFAEETGREKPPEWGYASSPLVLATAEGKTLAIVYAGNPKPSDNPAGNQQAVVAYDAETGETVWKAGVGFHSYSSPHLATLGGVEQVLVSSNEGLESFDPATGERLWIYDWSINEFPRSIQPLVVDEQTVIFSAGYDSGTQALQIIKADDGWKTEMLWHSHQLEPYFNDMVLYEGHLYGIHKKFLTCLNVETGEVTWPRKIKRKAKFGNGQLALDAGSGRLLLTAETSGEALLIEANPETLVVEGRLQALPKDTNWNHPVVAGGRLYVRNGEELACYELPLPSVASNPSTSNEPASRSK